jgi:hypothetical protein
VQRRGVRVTVISTISSQPPMIADELRRQADVFTDLVELQSKLGRDPSERPARASRVITRCNSCNAQPPGHHGAKTATWMIEWRALETRGTGSIPISFLKPIRAAVELWRERHFGTKTGCSKMVALAQGGHRHSITMDVSNKLLSVADVRQDICRNSAKARFQSKSDGRTFNPGLVDLNRR